MSASFSFPKNLIILLVVYFWLQMPLGTSSKFSNEIFQQRDRALIVLYALLIIVLYVL